MTIDDLTTMLAFDRAEYYFGFAPIPVWRPSQAYTLEEPDGPSWRAKVIDPIALGITSTHLLRRLYKAPSVGCLYVEALADGGSYWAKVPAALETQVLAAFGGK